MNEIRNFLLSPEEYLDTFWESDALIWVDWREYDESIIKYINERLPEEDKVKFTCVEIEKERDVDIILEKTVFPQQSLMRKNIQIVIPH